MAGAPEDTPHEENLRRFEQAARARARGEKMMSPEARAAACEVCKSSDVGWGALCRGCRGRLQAAALRTHG